MKAERGRCRQIQPAEDRESSRGRGSLQSVQRNGLAILGRSPSGLENMIKRVMVATVGAAMGSLAGLLAAYLGGGNAAIVIGALVGAVLPLLLLGAPGK